MRHLPTLAQTPSRGTRVVVQGRFGIIDQVTSTDLLVRFIAKDFVVSRRTESQADTSWIPWGDFVEVAGSTMLMDAESQRLWEAYRPHIKRKLMARLAVVCLVYTGTRSGHSDFVEDGEPLTELTPDKTLKVTPRTKLVAEFLENSNLAWVRALVGSLNANSQGDETVYRPPSGEAIGRWVRELRTGAGLFGLVDDRGGDRTKGFATGTRREDTERLVDEVIAARNYRTRSNTTDKWVMEQARNLAAEQDVALLGHTQLASMVSAKLNAAGRKPSERKTASHHRDRLSHQSPRAIYVGQVMSLDATVGDNLVRMTPDGVPLRSYVHVCVENSTGVFTSVQASGLYKEANVGSLMYEAFKPSLVVPDPDEVVRTRMKGMPERIHTSGAVFKPGAIPGRARADNAAQNHSRFVLGIAELMGVDVAPSSPGVSTDNSLAEASIGALRAFCEEQDGYVGRNTTERAEDVAKGQIMMVDEFEARLRHFAFITFNHARTTAPLYARTGLSRLQHWDDMIEVAGAPPMLLDRNALFSFLPRQTVTRTHKGLKVGPHYFSSTQLFGLPKHLVAQDGTVVVVFDPRRDDCVWVEDPVEGIVHEIPNRLRDVMEAPLVRGITVAALRRAKLRSLDGFHAAQAFAHHAAVIQQFERTARIDRELADWRGSVAHYMTAIRNGAVVIDSDGAVRSPADYPSGITPRPARTTARGERSRRSSRAGKVTAGSSGVNLEDLLDRPIALAQEA